MGGFTLSSFQYWASLEITQPEFYDSTSVTIALLILHELSDLPKRCFSHHLFHLLPSPLTSVENI